MHTHPAFERLPKRLTISFPMWILYARPGTWSPCYDIDRFMREHAERGFNCTRIDSGAGLIHDLDGNLRPPFYRDTMFGEYEKIPRQQQYLGEEGPVDLLARLIETFESAKRHGIYIILSQWYFLHTYWFHKAGDPIADELFAIPPHERFFAFAKFWHYILLELEKRGLDSQIVFVELFNEVNAHPYLCGEGSWDSNARTVPPEEMAQFRREHSEAIAWLKARHPQILFGYDSFDPATDEKCLPEGVDVYNFHSYYLWGLYDTVLRAHPEWFCGEITPATVAKSREGRRPASPDWYDRMALHTDLKPEYLAAAEAEMEKVFAEKRTQYEAVMEKNLRDAAANRVGAPIVCGEGVSYICHKELLWEEHSDAFWAHIKDRLTAYKKAGVWGTVIRTCCGPEDPSWTLCADRYRELNRYFLED